MKVLEFYRSSFTINWEKQHEKFEDLIKAISQSTLKDSLEKISIKGFRFTRNEGEDMLKSLGIGNIDIEA